MNKNTKKIVILGGVAAVGVAFWYFFLGPGATTTTTSPGSAPASTAVLPWLNPGNASEVNTVSNWISSFPASSATNAAQWLKYMETMGSQQDIDTMSALITQYWGANVAPPYALDNYFVNLSNAVNKVTLP
jgi:hypothetical protein